MSKIRENMKTGIILIPFIYVLVMVWPSLKAWFGLADDHLFAEAIISSKKSFNGYFDYYFNLQPWGQSPRFNPSELLGWTIETTLFGAHPQGWRLTQLAALLISAITVGLGVRNLGRLLDLSNTRVQLFSLLGQVLYLGLPFWSETIARIGAPETFAAVSLSLAFLNISNIWLQHNVSRNLIWLSINTMALVGFKENLIMIGICSLILQYSLIDKIGKEIKRKLIGYMLFQFGYIVFVIMGFLPQLLVSGQTINGEGVGLSRFVITKWIVIPCISIILLAVTFILSKKPERNKFFKINSLLLALALVEYFIMAGRLGGHYGFLSSIILATQVIVTLIGVSKFRRTIGGSILTFAILGMAFNMYNTLDYLAQTDVFKQELDQLQRTQSEQDLKNVIINVSSTYEYEAVSSVTSFAYNTNIMFYINIGDALSSGALQNNLVKYSNNGFKDWHIQPIFKWDKTKPCISVQFTTKELGGGCAHTQIITWLTD